MAPQTPRRGEVITRQGKKYRFEGVDAATGQWKLRPLGAAEGQSDAEGFARTAAQGATFGFSDEIAGGFGWLGGKGYKASRDRERENLAQYRGEHGKTAMLAEGLGGLATGLLAPGLLAAKAGGAGVRGAIGLARGGSAAARTARAAEVGGGLGKGGTALSKMGQAAKLGAAEGSIYGVGSGGEQRGATLGESLKSRALSGAGGAAMGLLSGGLMAGGLAAGSRGLDFHKGLKAGRLGKGGTDIIGKDLDDAAAAALPDSGPGGLVETGGSRAVAADDAAAHGLAELERVKDPKAFTARANEWLSKVDKKSPEYQKYLDSGQSEYYAATMQLAEDALKKEATPGAVPGLLADRSPRHSSTATLAARTTEGPQAGLLEGAAARPEALTRALDDVKPAFGERAFEAPGTTRTVERLKEEAGALAEENYDAAYSIFKANTTGGVDPEKIFFDPAYHAVIKRMTGSLMKPGSKLSKAMGEATEDARAAAVLKAENSGFAAKAANLGKARYTDILGSMRPDGSGNFRYYRPAKTSLTRTEGAEGIDIFRRTLDKVKEDMFGPDGNKALGRELKTMLEDFDKVIDVHSTKFADARAGYSGRNGISEAYQGAPSVVKQSQNSVKSYVDGLKAAGKDVRIQIGVDDAGSPLMRSELDMFKQGVLDDFVDRMDVSEVAAPHEIKKLKRQFDKLFGGDNPILDAAGADVKLIAQNLDDLAKQADLGKGMAEMKPMPAAADLEGMVEATAFGYALAGQPGAAARTGLASTVYGPGRWENVGGAMARRLRQAEGQGLLNVAETAAKTEGDRVRQLARRHAISGAIPGLLGGQRQESEFGGRYSGYTPRAARRRAWEEADERYGGN
tara:strand:+ start:1398 stop:3956 length:2559 start_codon:yes stop_codon:yes gene_type:complete